MSSSSGSSDESEPPVKKPKLLDEVSAQPASSSPNPLEFREKATAMSASSASPDSGQSAVTDFVWCMYATLREWYRVYVADAKQGEPRSIPSVWMLIFPRLFEKSWGYGRLYPKAFHEWCPYHRYLKEFYKCNCNLDAGLKAYKLCLKMEQQLMFEWRAQGINVPEDEITLSNNIQRSCLLLMFNGSDRLTNCTIAATCIAKETELIIERLRLGSSVQSTEQPPNQSTQIRGLALSVLTKDEPGFQPGGIAHLVTNVALLGIIKEAELMCVNLKRGYSNSCEIYLNRGIRAFAIELATVKLTKLTDSADRAEECRVLTESRIKLAAYIDEEADRNPGLFFDDLDCEESDQACDGESASSVMGTMKIQK